ncbi:MAG TPA: metal-sulfur cluster assembly factor [Oligoflexia bacterium]|mgnify:FL=1|nr:metal-sulfur cluster assembly factor [Oligoflexia bacterium]
MNGNTPNNNDSEQIDSLLGESSMEGSESIISKSEVIELIKSIIDPELYIDIWTLGLIYHIDIKETDIHIRMTFTSMACPAGPQLVGEIKDKLSTLPAVKEVEVEVVFDPPWEPSEDLKALMGIL